MEYAIMEQKKIIKEINYIKDNLITSSKASDINNKLKHENK
jgi:hypothetical protein